MLHKIPDSDCVIAPPVNALDPAGLVFNKVLLAVFGDRSKVSIDLCAASESTAYKTRLDFAGDDLYEMGKRRELLDESRNRICHSQLSLAQGRFLTGGRDTENKQICEQLDPSVEHNSRSHVSFPASQESLISDVFW